MEFTLTYRGVLKSGNSSNTKHKHDIRRCIHKQLKHLWKFPPLNMYINNADNHLDEKRPSNFVRSVKKFKFIPLINEIYKSFAEIKIIILRPDPIGTIITNSGDIDNTLKTFFDALRMPCASELKGIEPEMDENPFFCLLEDDKLITKVTVDTAMLLQPEQKSPYAEILLQVKTKTLIQTYDNFSLS